MHFEDTARCDACGGPSTHLGEYGRGLSDACAARLEGYVEYERDCVVLDLQRAVNAAVEVVGSDAAAGVVTAALAPSLLSQELGTAMDEIDDQDGEVA
jgi:hypothetical protein